MPTAPTLVQFKSGSGLGTEGTTPVVASLDSAVTAGNTILIFVGAYADIAASSTPPVLSGRPMDFDVDVEDNWASNIDTAIMVLRRTANDAEPTTWDLFPWGTSQRVSWLVCEYSGLSTEYHPYVSSSTNAWFTTGASNPFTAGTTGTLGWSGTLQFALFIGHPTVTCTWSGYTGGFSELADLGVAPCFAVASAYSTSTAGATCQAVNSHTSTNNCLGAVVAYRVVDATFSGDLLYQNGFEIGTANGIANTTNPTASTRVFSSILGTVGTDILFGSSYAAGSWSTSGMRIVQSAAAKYARVDSTILGTQLAFVPGFHVRVVSSTGQVVLFEMNQANGLKAQLLYDTATSKLGLVFATENIAWQTGTTAHGTWVWIDWLMDNFGGAYRRLQWRINGVVQPERPSLASIATPNSVGNFNFGGNVAQTVTVDFDDSIFSGVAGMYPLGRHHVRLLKVDPAGTPSISGTAANFNVFTANGTLAAWNATNARNALDDVPPTISASADGICQVTTAASDYAEIPMETFVLAGPETCSGVRMFSALWGGTGAGAGTIRIDGYDGSAAATLYPIGTAWDPDSLTTPSSTVPPWVTEQWRPAGGWTQAKLDAMALRFGFSNDATPDMGAHCFLCEAAIKANTFDENFPVHSWRVDYTDGTSHASASGPPTVTTGVRGVTYWHDPAPYTTMDHGWSAYRVAGVTLFGETEDPATFEAWRLSVLAEPHPLA